MPLFLSCFQLAGLALFLSIFLGRTLYLRIRSKITAIALDVRKGWRGLVEVVLFALVNVWALEVVLYAIRSPFRLFPAALHTTLLGTLPAALGGVLLVTLGLAIFVRAILDLGNSWRLGIDEKHPGKLVTTGIYAVSRHPIYLFFNLYFLGTFLLNGTLIFLLLAFLVALNLHIQALIEERFLLRLYGGTYRDYCRRTGRYLGWRSPRPAVEPPADPW